MGIRLCLHHIYGLRVRISLVKNKKHPNISCDVPVRWLSQVGDELFVTEQSSGDTSMNCKAAVHTGGTKS